MLAITTGEHAMAMPILFGPGFSTFVRTCRITLTEKGVEYEHREFNFLEGWPEGYEKRHPFKKVPAFSHDDMDLHESSAICRYVDEAFEGPALQPVDVRARAHMNRVVEVVQNYAYGAMITRTFIPRAVAPMLGGTTDESVIEAAKPEVELSARVLDGYLAGSDYLAGETATLADFFALPVVHYLSQIPDGQAVLSGTPALSAWLGRMNARASVTSTVPQLG
jgi:glutathione S-transferase